MNCLQKLRLAPFSKSMVIIWITTVVTPSLGAVFGGCCFTQVFAGPNITSSVWASLLIIIYLLGNDFGYSIGSIGIYTLYRLYRLTRM